MDNGPIVSRIYDLIRGKIYGPEMDSWRKYFNPRNDNNVTTCADPGVGPLSPREIEILSEVYEQIKDMPVREVIEMTHQLPEWKDPQGSRLEIDPKVMPAWGGAL